MALIKISDTEGNVHEIDFPSNLSELPYSRKIDFDVACEDIALWAKACEESEDPKKGDTDAYFCYLLSRAVSAYTGADMSTILRLDVGDIVTPYGRLKATPKDLPEQVSDLDNVEHTLYQMYHVAKSVINGYKFEFRTPDNFEINHKGTTWIVPHVVKQLYDGRKVFTKTSTAQAVESMMIRNYLEEHINNRPREEVTSEEVANARFTAHLNLLAICLSEKDKDGNVKGLPLDESDFDREVARRVPLFEDIDTKTALDVIFFLTTITTNSRKTPKIPTSLIPQVNKLAKKYEKQISEFGNGQSIGQYTQG